MIRGLTGKTSASLWSCFASFISQSARLVNVVASQSEALTSSYWRRFYSRHACEAVQEANGFTRRLADSWDSEELKTLPEHLRPVKGETLDLILRQKVYLLQSRRGYRANVDSHMLALFASDAYVRTRQCTDSSKLRVLDLGAGNGVVSVLFAKAHAFCHVQLLELQPQLADRARRNLELNDIYGTVTQHDIKNGELPKSVCGKFDIVLINPPFYPNGSRKPPKHSEKYLAQIETSASLSDFLSAAHAACDSQNADAFIAVIHDRKELPRLRQALYQNNLTIHESRELLHVAGDEPSRIMLQVKPVKPPPSFHAEKQSWNDTMICSSDMGQDGHMSPDTFTPSLPPLVLHPSCRTQRVYTDEIEEFLEKLPLPSLRIGRLRDSEEV